jgi:hypothetical protein
MTTAARHGRKARKPLVVSVVLVDCLIYRGLPRSCAATRRDHHTVTHPHNQDEKGSLILELLSMVVT